MQYKGHLVAGAQQECVLVSEWVLQTWEHGNWHGTVIAVSSLANCCLPIVNQRVWNTTLSVAAVMALIPHNRVPAKTRPNLSNVMESEPPSLSLYPKSPENIWDGEQQLVIRFRITLHVKKGKKRNFTLDQEIGAFIMGLIWARCAGTSSTTWTSSRSDSTKWCTSKISPNSL